MSERFNQLSLKGLLTVWFMLAAWAPLQLQALTDPTRPAEYRAAAQRISFNLESILFSNARRVAVINGKVLAEGERIGDATVTSIGKDSVRLQQSGRVIRLTLQRPLIRQEK